MTNKQAIHERIMRIMNLTYLINVETDFAAFVYFSGHVDQLDVSVRESKEFYNEKLASFDKYSISTECKIEELDHVIASLEGFLGNEVPYDLLRAVEVKAIKYLL